MSNIRGRGFRFLRSWRGPNSRIWATVVRNTNRSVSAKSCMGLPCHGQSSESTRASHDYESLQVIMQLPATAEAPFEISIKYRLLPVQWAGIPSAELGGGG